MPIQDKRGLLAAILLNHKDQSFEIELGCGSRKRSPSAIGIDRLDVPGVDIVGEIEEVMEVLPVGSISTIRSFHVLEHLDNFDRIIRQLAAALKEGGALQIVVPHFSNPHYYSDYTHKRFFGLYSLSYLARDELFRRRVPNYGLTPTLTLDDVRLVFKSSPPFYLRHSLKVALSTLINCTRYCQETYEELFCWIAPCYEIDFRLTKRSGAR